MRSPEDRLVPVAWVVDLETSHSRRRSASKRRWFLANGCRTRARTEHADRRMQNAGRFRLGLCGLWGVTATTSSRSSQDTGPLGGTGAGAGVSALCGTHRQCCLQKAERQAPGTAEQEARRCPMGPRLSPAAPHWSPTPLANRAVAATPHLAPTPPGRLPLGPTASLAPPPMQPTVALFDPHPRWSVAKAQVRGLSPTL